MPPVKKWLDELKHVVYEAEQILDEIATDSMLNEMKAESEPVTNFISGMWSSITPNPFEPRINEVLKNLQLLADRTKDLRLEDGPSASKEGLVSWKPSKRSETTALVGESSMYVRDVRKQELIKILLEGNDRGNQVPIISIVGLGGMGKTTLAKLVCNDKKIKEHFELQAWVYVSESFDEVGLTKAILESFKISADGENLSLLQQQLQHELTGKKYLLVLDDIWNVNAACWEDLLLPFNHGSSGSKIIVTTREKKIEDVLISKLFELQQLDKSDCWRLFETHAFHGRDTCEYPELESIGKKIVNKCGGLPLAVKTMGQLLGRKFSVPEWRKIQETDMGQLFDEDNKVNPTLRLSYHNLLSNHKRCFAYCSIFPKGYEFDKGELIRFWMAEGLLKCWKAHKSEEEFGSEIFSDLESISFLQQSLSTKAFTHEQYFVMHDLVNDLAKSVSGEFCMQIEGKEEVISERTRHIRCSLQLNCVNKLLEPIVEVKGLRSLILKGGETMLIGSKVQHDLFSRLKCLRMLSFRGRGLSELVDEISNLKLLRYLDLSYTKIKRLPDTICTLYNLQTLLLQWCYELTELPSNFSKLINLRHLELPPYLEKMPKNIGKLKNLQTLTHFFVDKQKESDLKELAKINHLHGLIIIKGLGNIIDQVDAAKANLKDKKYLEELHMVFDGRREEMDDSTVENNVSVLEALQPNSNLKRLTVHNYNGKCFPNWLKGYHLPNLVCLNLWSCGQCSHFPPLGQFPCLKKLSISHCDGIKTISKGFYENNNSTSLVPFRSLEFLKFEKMDTWEEWLCLEGFPLLKKLCIRECPELKRVLLQRLPCLQKLEISDCNKLEEWLCLEGFPLLKKICIRRCHELKRVPTQYIPSLRNLEMNDCNKLEECLCLEGFPFLKEVSIERCSKLKRAPLPQHIPSLQKLTIYDCEMMETSIPKGDSTIEIGLLKCDRILVNELPTSLKKFVLWGNGCSEFSVEQSLENCTILEELNLDLRGFVKHPSLDLRCYNSLRELSIKGWHSSSLPFSLHLFPNIHSLGLHDFPQLESFPIGGLPSCLSSLTIKKCPKLIASREEWGLFQLNSLKEFVVNDHEFENVESFPEENLLPPTLEYLVLMNCSKLKIMNYKGFLHLNSLNELRVVNCPSLESLPEEGLPSSQLWTRKCPLIWEKYKKEGGERWHTIRHIPNVHIDGI